MRRARRAHAAQRVLAEVLEPDNLARAFALSAAVGAADDWASSERAAR